MRSVVCSNEACAFPLRPDDRTCPICGAPREDDDRENLVVHRGRRVSGPPANAPQGLVDGDPRQPGAEAGPARELLDGAKCVVVRFLDEVGKRIKIQQRTRLGANSLLRYHIAGKRRARRRVDNQVRVF